MGESVDAHRQQENANAAAAFEALMQRRTELIEGGRLDDAVALEAGLQQACDRYFATLSSEESRALHYVEPGKTVTWREWIAQESLEADERHSDPGHPANRERRDDPVSRSLANRQIRPNRSQAPRR